MSDCILWHKTILYKNKAHISVNEMCALFVRLLFVSSYILKKFVYLVELN